MAKLEKQLGLLSVFAVASGAMISSGLFVLPAIAYAKAGPAIISAYFLASILVIPSVLSQAELSSAMPKAGGTYFFVERSLGSILGLFSGLANWFAVALKSAFAIIGMAILIKVLLHPVQLSGWYLKMIAVLCCLFFTALNIVSVKHTSRFQVWMVAILLAILTVFVFLGSKNVETVRYAGFMDKGVMTILATAGLVFVSFGGLTKVTSIAEEVRHPERNLPLGMILAWFVVTVFYIAVIIITVGVMDGSELTQSYMPISMAAAKFMGTQGFVLLALAAMAAFVTTANGGILAASRYPMAMSRDQLLPPILANINKQFKTPYISILLTGGFIIIAIVLLDIEVLVKTASTLMIILFILVNASVIVMRESRIQSYRPKFRTPLYPYIQIFAIVIYGVLITDMGKIPLLTTLGFVVLSAAWYFFYVTKRVSRASAIMHIVERVTDRALKTVTLEDELRDILLERDDIIKDRFDQLITQCRIIDVQGRKTAEEVFKQASKILEKRLDVSQYIIFEKFLQREQQGGTIIQPGFAIPHIVIGGQNKFDIIVVRAVKGIDFPNADVSVKTMFILVGTKDERNYHLRALMAIAHIAQEKNFEKRWLAARDIQSVRNLILLSTRKRDAAVLFRPASRRDFAPPLT